MRNIENQNGDKNPLQNQSQSIGANGATANFSPADRDANVTELASLSVLEYEKCREDVAKSLGVRVSVLDKEVVAASTPNPKWKFFEAEFLSSAKVRYVAAVCTNVRFRRCITAHCYHAEGLRWAVNTKSATSR